MARGRGIIGIFRQNMHFFLNFLVVWRARVQALAVCEATCKTASSLEDK
jgi:hypothetical protein